MLEITARGNIATTSSFYETNVKGVYAVSDCAMLMKSATIAVASGTARAVSRRRCRWRWREIRVEVLEDDGQKR